MMLPDLDDVLAGSCEEQEAVGYPEMEATVRSTLAGVDYSMTRTGSCQFTMSPESVLTVTVKEWPNRRVAVRFLLQHGWANLDGGLTNADGSYDVGVSTARDELHTNSYAQMMFSDISDYSDD